MLQPHPSASCRPGRWLILAVLTVALCAALPLHAAEPLPLNLTTPARHADLGALATGGHQAFTVKLAQPQALDLRVTFDDAPFAGAQLNVTVNATRLLPYFAFGGDMRYDSVKGKPGLHPPIATIEGRWLIPPGLLHAGNNAIELWTEGAGLPGEDTGRKPGATPTAPGTPSAKSQIPNPKSQILRDTPSLTRISGLTLRPADGTNLPQYANPIYFDWSVWAQGYDYGPDAARRYRYDLALLGIINGKGMPDIIPPLPVNNRGLWAAKREAESNVLDWGFGNQCFYTIWQLSARPDLWARFVDVDHNPKTQTRFHEQAIDNNVQERDPAIKGADICYYDVPTYAKTLEPAIRGLGPYMTYYEVKCEQHGPFSQGFGDDGEAWAQYGIHGSDWAKNFADACAAVHDLVQKYNPEGRIEEMNHWIPSIRYVLFDTALARHQPMSGLIDILCTHFSNLFSYDLDAQGHIKPGETLSLQYPGGTFGLPSSFFFMHLIRHGFIAHQDLYFPEIAIDFNRYRLSRTAADMKPRGTALPGGGGTTATLGDPKVDHWGNGQPFDYRAGFRGDELMYNSENGIWFGYSAPSPYQYLQGFLSYSLLPTGASEPRNLKVTVRRSLTQTQDLPVNLYGHWVDGVAHTKRLRTVDPLYGDMFGWTGDEHCNMGDYISMVGIKDWQHRRPGADAFNLVRRIGYGFVTTGTVLPAYENKGHDETLMVKTLREVFEGRPYYGIYAANFDAKPHDLDVTLAVPFAKATEAMVFDDRAWDWSSAKKETVPAGPSFSYRHAVPGLSAWLVLIPAPEGTLAAGLDLPAAPMLVSPAPDGLVAQGAPVLSWQPPVAPGFRPVSSDAATKYEVEVAREALFRGVDRVEFSPAVNGSSWTMTADLSPKARYFWRVAAVDAQGRRGPWSPSRPFVYAWPQYAAAFPTGKTPPPAPPPWRPARTVGQNKPAWQKLADAHGIETTPNLAWQAEIYATGGFMHAPARAVDGQADSYWTNGTNEDNNNFDLPAQWCAIWPQPVTIHAVQVLWMETLLPAEFTVEVSDDAKTWKTLGGGKTPTVGYTEVNLAEPVKAKYIRIAIPTAVNKNKEVGIREVVVR